MEKDDGNDPKCGNNCFVTFAEAEFNGDKFWAVLLGGKLDNDGVHKPFLVDMTNIFRTPTGVTVFTRIMTVLTKLGLDDASSKLRLFVIDSAAYNYVPAQMLNENFL